MIHMQSVDQLIRKVSRYVSFGQPVSSGSVVSQRISDPRIPMQAYYLSLKAQSEQDQYYHEVWLKKEGSFAITEAWYKESSVTRKLHRDNLSYEQLTLAIGEEEANAIMMRITEIIKKSEKEDWRPLSRRA
jgi:S-adenosylmethionine:tRNA-ribosyltransferase-isomerase (queuine synthetase)